MYKDLINATATSLTIVSMGFDLVIEDSGYLKS